jgi:hypothetical protein
VRRRSRLGLLAAFAAAGAVVLPSAALANDAGSVTHTAGAVSATLEWDKADLGIGNPRLFVTRAGVRYDQPIADICIVVPDAGIEDASQSAVKVADLNGDGEPEILVDVFSGGAHCCVTTRLLSWNGATGYATKDIFWGDLGYVLEDADGDGRQELVGADPRFSAAFTAYAGSGFPPQVLAVGAGGVVSDVTRAFPKLVRADAAKRLKVLRKARRGDDVRGIAAAYVADEYLLGRGMVGTRELDRLQRKGLVTAKFKPYVVKRLKAWGYRGGVAKASAASGSIPLDRVTLNGYAGALSVASKLSGPARTRSARFGVTITEPETTTDGASSGAGSHATLVSRVAERGRPPVALQARSTPCGGFTAVVGTATPRIARITVRHADGTTDGLRLRTAPAGWHYKGHFVGQFLDSASKVVSARAVDSAGHTVLTVKLAGGAAC